MSAAEVSIERTERGCMHVEYLQMSERVKNLEGQIQALHVDLEELTTTLKKLLSIEGSGEFWHEQTRLPDYIS